MEGLVKHGQLVVCNLQDVLPYEGVVYEKMMVEIESDEYTVFQQWVDY